jgi:hypothetical protein
MRATDTESTTALLRLIAGLRMQIELLTSTFGTFDRWSYLRGEADDELRALGRESTLSDRAQEHIARVNDLISEAMQLAAAECSMLADVLACHEELSAAQRTADAGASAAAVALERHFRALSAARH